MNDVLSTYYPPMFLSSFLPAFPRNQSAIVPFRVSQLNSQSQVANNITLQVSLIDQKTNNNAFKKDAMEIKNGFYHTTFSLLEGYEDVYKLEIPVNILNTPLWKNNSYYQLQIRLCKGEQPVSEWSTVLLLRAIAEPKLSLRYLSDSNTEIQQLPAYNKGVLPIVGRLNFSEHNEEDCLASYSVNVSDYGTNQVFTQTQSPIIYTNSQNDPNNINYYANLAGINNLYSKNILKLNFSYETRNGYKVTKSFPFRIAEYNDNDTDWQPILTVTPNEFKKSMTIKFHNNSQIKLLGDLVFRRSSNRSNYAEWEDLGSYSVNNKEDIVIEDTTIESGVLYKYLVQYISSKNVYSTPAISTATCLNFFDATLSRKDKQISLPFDFKISNFKPVVSRTKTETLGSKYPKFTENAVLNYKQFSFSALISTEMDRKYDSMLSALIADPHAPKEMDSIYSKAHPEIKDEEAKREAEAQLDLPIDFYSSYEQSNFLSPKQFYNKHYRDFDPQTQDESSMTDPGFYTSRGNDTDPTDYYYTWEKDFREILVSWLNDGEPKLFRSQTEGNMVVILMDVSLTPEVKLSRRLYRITATAIEVADGSKIDNLVDLGIFQRNDVNEEIFSQIQKIQEKDTDSIQYIFNEKIGRYANYSLKEIYQTQDQTWDSTKNFVKFLYDIKQQEFQGVKQHHTLVEDKFVIENVKLQFHTPPHLYKLKGQNIEPFNPVTDVNIKPVKGYKVWVTTDQGKETALLINERGYYQTPEDVIISSLRFDDGDDVITVDYKITSQERASDAATVSKTVVEKTVVGQELGSFQPFVNFGYQLRQKYLQIKNNSQGQREFFQQMQWWKGIRLETDPYSIVAIKYENSYDYRPYIVSRTGVLDLFEDMQVNNIQFQGKMMEVVNLKNNSTTHKAIQLEPWECQLSNDIDLSAFIKASPKEMENIVSNPKPDMIPGVRELWRIFYDMDSKSALNFKDIKRPIYNTIYEIDGQLYIYYVNQQWYPVQLVNHGENVAAIVKMPVEGNLYYWGDIIRNYYQQ